MVSATFIASLFGALGGIGSIVDQARLAKTEEGNPLPFHYWSNVGVFLAIDITIYLFMTGWFLW
jgi:hypothetical protein